MGTGPVLLSTLRGPGEAMASGSRNQDYNANMTVDEESQTLKGKLGGENMLFLLIQ